MEFPPAAGPSRDRYPAPPRRRFGPLIAAAAFIVLALAGVGWFFQEQVKIAWHGITARFSKSDSPASPEIDPAVASLVKKVQQQPAGPTPVAPGAAPGKLAPAVAQTAAPGPSAVPPVAPTPDQPAPGAVQPTPPNAPAKSDASIAATLLAAPENPPTTPPVVRKAEPATSLPGRETGTIMRSTPVETPRKALPVDGEESRPSAPGTPPLPTMLSPVPPSPPRPGSDSLVEVRPATGGGRGSDAAPDGAGGSELFVKAGVESKPAAEALKRFFQARTWQERLELTQAADRMKPLMERYYASNPDGPLRIKSIELLRHDKAPETGPPLCVFQVSGADVPEPLPVMVESGPGGWKVDWLSFTEFKDKLLLRYLQKWQDEPARFHVMLRRTHYFDEDVPALDKKHCFELMPPTPGYSGFAFVPKGSPLAQTLDRSIGWEIANLAAIVELQWRRQDRYQWVEITAVPQFNWRTGAGGPSLAKPAKSADAPKTEPGAGEVPVARPISPGRAPAVADKK